MVTRIGLHWVFAALVIVLIGTIEAKSAVDDGATKKWIMASLTNKFGYDGAPNIDGLIDQAYKVDDVHDAWRRLKGCRDAGNTDLSLAAAEHYMYARYLASEMGDTSLVPAPRWYESFKSWATQHDLQQWLQTTNQPVSIPDPNVKAWGDRGIEKGLKDYKARTGKDPKAGAGALLAVLGVSLAVYLKYLPTNPACPIAIK